MSAFSASERDALRRAVSVHGRAWDCVAASGACPVGAKRVSADNHNRRVYDSGGKAQVKAVMVSFVDMVLY